MAKMANRNRQTKKDESATTERSQNMGNHTTNEKRSISSPDDRQDERRYTGQDPDTDFDGQQTDGEVGRL